MGVDFDEVIVLFEYEEENGEVSCFVINSLNLLVVSMNHSLKQRHIPQPTITIAKTNRVLLNKKPV